MTVLNLIAGDDYLAADSRSIKFTEPAVSDWPNDLDTQTVTLVVTDDNNNIMFTLTSTTVDTDTAVATISFDLAHANSSKLGVGTTYHYKVLATSGSGHVTTLMRDTVKVS